MTRPARSSTALAQATPVPLEQPTRDRITGVLLAGGLSRRMAAFSNSSQPTESGEPGASEEQHTEAPAGSSTHASIDKGLLSFQGQPLAAHVLSRLRPQVGSVLINANRHPEAWETFGESVVADRREGFAGPLAGLEAALAAAPTPWVLTVPCDGPLFPLDLAARLSAAAHQQAAWVASARTATQAHPVYMLAHRASLPELSRFLDSGRRRIDAWMATVPHVEVVFSDESAFANLNTPQEFAAAQAAIAAGGALSPPSA